MNTDNILTNEELEKVSGGFNETQGYAKGIVITCPKCGASAQSYFEMSSVDALGQSFYRCSKCGQSFLMDAGGYGTKLNGVTGQFNAPIAPL